MALNLLALNPEKEIGFPKLATCTQPVTRKLIVTNCSNNEFVAFKVKTTAPKSYLVRPSSGILSGKGASAEISIILQPQGEATENHRFMVQGAVVSSKDDGDKEMWRALAKEQIHEQRLNVAWQEGATSAAPVAASPTPVAASNASQAYGDDATLKSKYDALVQQVSIQKKEMDKLQAQVADAKKGSSGTSEGYALKDLILVAVISFILAFLLRYL